MSVRPVPGSLKFFLLFATWTSRALFPAAALRAADEPDAESRAGWQKMAEYDTGMVVWESNRSGRWRIWRRGLDGSDYRQLTPEENGRDQVCPHISPDGTRLVYLSCAAGQDPNKGGHPLHLMLADGSGDRVLIPSARAYGGDRAVVWFDSQHFAYIDGEGYTQEFDLESGKGRRITSEAQKDNGLLLNATRTFITIGYPPTFSQFDSGNSRITPQAALGGCEPYFSHDGRWGFWMGGAGGPINRIELATRQVSPILAKDDPRMPKGRAYLYFPMVSRDGRFFTFAASPNQHDHDKSDYDVFVARLDPKSLEVLDRPVRYTFDPGTDRYPDVFVGDLELGRFAGEAPFSVSFPAPKPDGEWTWDFGDGQTATGPAPKHTFEKAGEYRISARQKDRVLHAAASVAPAAPPKATAATVSGPAEVVVAFDEPIQLQNASAKLESGAKVAEVSVAKDGRRLIVKLADKLTKPDGLVLAGVADRAERPNVISSLRLPVNPATWPVSREGLLYLMQTVDAPNQIAGSDGKARSYTLHPRGRARPDHSQALVLADGSYVAEGAASDLLAALRSKNELTVEAYVRPGHFPQNGPARIVTFSSTALERNFTLGQQEDRLIFRLRTTKTNLNGVAPEVELGRLSADGPRHIVVTYRPGELLYYGDGKLLHRDQRIQGDFSNWSEQQLLFGDEFNGERKWAGTLEGVAIFNRALSPDEVRQDFERYRNVVEARPPVARIEVTAKLIAKSPVPTRDEVKPYRGALMTCKYEVLKVLSGQLPAKQVLVSHWALLDAQPQAVVALKPGAEVKLALEPSEQNPQLQRYVCKDGFDSDDELLLPRYYDVTP
jgi:hypothetical protein